MSALTAIVLAVAGVAPAARPFLMGFTPWPSDLTVEAVQSVKDYLHKKGDVVSVMMIGGIPWQEALTGKEYSQDVKNNFAYKPPAGTKLFLSISPLNMDRSGLAPHWGEKDNEPLDSTWAGRPFDSPEVTKAYIKFVHDAVEAMHPDFLAVGVELNVLLSKSPAKWAGLKRLHQEAYKAVKAEHPKLPVFFTTELNHYLKYSSEAVNTPQEAEVADLMKSSDVFAMSLYPHMTLSQIGRYVPDLRKFPKKFAKPVAVSECGMSSREVLLPTYHVTLNGSEQQQTEFYEEILQLASADKYQFVITFACSDFEKLTKKLPNPIGEIASIWQYTGLRDDNSAAKPALRVWEHWFGLPFKP